MSGHSKWHPLTPSHHFVYVQATEDKTHAIE